MKPPGDASPSKQLHGMHETTKCFEGGGKRRDLEAETSPLKSKQQRLFQASKNVCLLFQKEGKAYDNVDAF